MLAPLLILAAVSVAPIPKGASFGHWIAACDNVRHCEAIAIPDEGAENGWTLHVTREAAAEAEPEVEAVPQFGDGEQQPARLRIDGKLTPFGFTADGSATGQSAAILSALASARTADLVDTTGKAIGFIPTQGTSATLRWIDDRQQRAGTVTALIAKGARGTTAVPAPPPLPKIAVPPVSKKPPRKLAAADARRIKQLAGDLCEDDRHEVGTYRLDATHSLGIVGCMMGAYQGASLVVVSGEDGRWSPAPIEQPTLPAKNADPADAYLLTEADFSPEARLLTSMAKGRGIADCGLAASWAWNGRMFRLTSYVALDQCRGAPPGMWLPRWQTANDPLTRD